MVANSKRDARVETLKQLIAERIGQAPHERDGHLWAAELQRWWCDQLGVSDTTLRATIGAAPFVKKTTKVDGRKMTLLRIGPPDPKTVEDWARILSSIWRSHFDGRRLDRREWGCCCELVRQWPEGQAPELLKVVLADWESFMAGAKIEMAELEAEGQGQYRYFKFPSLPVILRFRQVAVDMLTMKEQANAAKAA